MTPFVEGLTAKQLLLTYVIPVIPIAYAWDGQASLPRIYSKGDIEIMLSEIGSVENYEWKIKPALNQKGKKQGYVILGKSTLLS